MIAIFNDLLESLGEKASNELDTILNELDVSYSDPITHWGDIYHSHYSNSLLNCSRQIEIIQQLVTDIPMLAKRKQQILEKHQGDLSGSVNDASWWAVDTTRSKLGYRLTLGLKNGGCKYWQNSKNKLGCLNCGYFIASLSANEVTITNLYNQFSDVLEKSKLNQPKYDVIEFLNDGSFLNDEEIPEDARRKIFEKIALEENITKVVIESRPEYITKNKIVGLIEMLRADQSIEIAIGLETSDPFIQTFIINKGYHLKEFIESLEVIARINEEYQNRVGVFSYVLVKTAYITEGEAVSDVIGTIKDIHHLKSKYPFISAVKLESVVVAKGTILEIIANDENRSNADRYSPISYWSIIEIVARFNAIGSDLQLRIATREDMDSFTEFPGLFYNNSMISRYDFVLYNAIQRFVKHQSLSRLFAEIEPALNDKSYENWIAQSGIEKPIFPTCYSQYKGEIQIIKSEPEFQNRLAFENEILRAKDAIEYDVSFQRVIALILTEKHSNYEDDVVKSVSSCITKYLPKAQLLSIDNIKLIPNELKMVRAQIKIRHKDNYYSIWTCIPTALKFQIDRIMKI